SSAVEPAEQTGHDRDPDCRCYGFTGRQRDVGLLQGGVDTRGEATSLDLFLGRLREATQQRQPVEEALLLFFLGPAATVGGEAASEGIAALLLFPSEEDPDEEGQSGSGAQRTDQH